MPAVALEEEGNAVLGRDRYERSEEFGGYINGCLRTLGEPAEIEGLDGPTADIVGWGPGMQLQLVNPAPRLLESAAGRLMGFALYGMLWWDRGPGEPGLALTGTDADRITHAFKVHGLEGLEALARYRQPSNPPFRTSSNAGFPQKYPLNGA